MDSTPLGDRLAALHPAQVERLRAAVQPAPHVLASGIAHAALDLSELDPLLAVLDATLLPLPLQRMVQARLRTFLAGRLCAEHALAQLGIRPGGLAPGALGAPDWPSGITGSIAHTGQIACAAVAPVRTTAGLGIDSEHRADARTADQIRRTCCTPREREHLFGQGDDRLTATLIFSAKESFYKAVSATVGRVVEFDEVEVQAIDDGHGRVTLTPVSASLARCVPPAQARICVRAGTVHTSVVLPSAGP